MNGLKITQFGEDVKGNFSMPEILGATCCKITTDVASFHISDFDPRRGDKRTSKPGDKA